MSYNFSSHLEDFFLVWLTPGVLIKGHSTASVSRVHKSTFLSLRGICGKPVSSRLLFVFYPISQLSVIPLKELRSGPNLYTVDNEKRNPPHFFLRPAGKETRVSWADKKLSRRVALINQDTTINFSPSLVPLTFTGKLSFKSMENDRHP